MSFTFSSNSNNLTGVTFNAGGTKTDLTQVADYMLLNHLDFICLQDIQTSTLHQMDLQQQNIALAFSNSSTTNKSARVAILYSLHTFHPHTLTLTDDSSRIMGIVLQPLRYKLKILLLSIYLPPGLDNTIPLAANQLSSYFRSEAERLNEIPFKNAITSRNKRLEAERLILRLHSWLAQVKPNTAILGGDFNETIYPTDRLPIQKCTTYTNKTLFQFSYHSHWTDAYNWFMPLEQENDDLSSPEHLGHTYYHYNGSSSKLDHFFVWPPPRHQSYITHCAVDNSLTLNTQRTQHRPLGICVKLTGASDHDSYDEWSSNLLFIPKNLTPQIASQISRVVNEALCPTLLNLCDQFQQLQTTNNSELNSCSERQLNTLTAHLTSALFNTYHANVGGKFAGTRRVSYTRKRNPNPLSAAFLNACRARLFLTTLIQHVTNIIQSFSSPRQPFIHRGNLILPAYSFYCKKAQRAKTGLLQLANHKHLLQGFPRNWNASQMNLTQWKLWLHRTNHSLIELSASIKQLKQQRKDAFNKYKKELFSTSKGRGKYYAHTFHHRSRTQQIGGAWDSNGLYSTDPSIYKKLVHEHVSKPFSKAYLGPAVNASRSLSIEEQKSGCPDWWKTMYTAGAGYPHAHHLKFLGEHITPHELKHTLIHMSRYTTPGPDGISTAVLKLLTNTYYNSSPTPTHNHTIIFIALLAQMNAALRLGVQAPCLRNGMITLIPKPPKDPIYVQNRRPISLLQELFKLPNRVLANRFVSAMSEYPILHKSNRAYSKDGNTTQCLDTIILNTQHALSTNHNLFLVSYDIAKAFDSVQRYSITATLHRYNIPKNVTAFTVSGLTNATSSVITKDGPTNPISLRSSIRQGDPLAAIIFLFIMDVLHIGLEYNPFKPLNLQTGYTIHNEHAPHPTTYSIGYADDTTTTNNTWAAVQVQHTWVMDFMIAHRFSLNADKTECLSMQPLPDHAHYQLATITPHIIHDPCNNLSVVSPPYASSSTPILPNTPIGVRPLNTTIRILGLQYNTQLTPDAMVQKMNICVYGTAKHIKDANLYPSQSSFIIKEYLYSKLEMGLLFYNHTTAQLNTWDRIILQAAFPTNKGSHLNRFAQC